ncbi:MAG: hypothetical protein COZ12_02900 [Deltaproteobacteria bacterium CG_4_10_14_3_um_filter_60_8]|nr:MAG: hypothetical protein AUK28_08025 [Desulfobacterales bacterium CG2_30_60_27]PIP44128.1 MAG: hypothetical protein COX17_03205 [Deltaproteobacteria bacterium CG23_combo_of_CG06-09_8_20_14_all_60_8]PIY22612.1 MAG: hypothetical protein COZ12_02900 [Deltaproteobacteria bacterium CG_4_10_14_3_um_filter_60_8]
MNHSHCRPIKERLSLALALAVLLTGCARSIPVQYYQLSAMREVGAPAEFAVSKEATIGLGPVSLPEYLVRPQIVSRTSANRLSLSDRQRWAEPLAENLPRVLAEDLSALLGTDRILPYPWTRGRTIDCQIRVEVLQFEGGPNGTANLIARWQVTGKDGLVLLPEKRSSFNLTATAQDQESMTVALSQAISHLAREIAAALPPLLAQGR